MNKEEIPEKSVFYMSPSAVAGCHDIKVGDVHPWGNKRLFGAPVVVDRFCPNNMWYLVDTEQLAKFVGAELDKIYGRLPWDSKKKGKN